MYININIYLIIIIIRKNQKKNQENFFILNI